MKKLLKWFLIWRLYLFIPLYLGLLFIPFRKNYLFTTIENNINQYSFIKNKLIYIWSNFDGVHYLAIASRGYITEGRFMPLFPILTRLVSLPISSILNLDIYELNFYVSFLLSNLLFFLSLLYLKKLLKLDYSDNVVNKVILLLIIFPTSFFFVSIYTESLFLLLSILVLFFARKKRWKIAIFFSMLLSITRLPGILILLPLLYEYITCELKTSFNKKQFITSIKYQKLLKFLIVPIPLIIYSIFNYYKWSDFLYFVHSHASLGNGREVNSIVFPLIIVYRYIKIFLTVSSRQYEFFIAFIELLSLIVATFGLIVAFRKKIRPSYLIFSLAILILPLFSGTLTGFPRYILLAFPIFIGLSLKINFSKFYWKLIIITSFILQSYFLILFSRGWFIA